MVKIIGSFTPSGSEAGSNVENSKRFKIFLFKIFIHFCSRKKFYIATFSAPIVSGRQLGIKSYHNCWLTSVAFGYDLKIIKICEFWGDPHRPVIIIMTISE